MIINVEKQNRLCVRLKGIYTTMSTTNRTGNEHFPTAPNPLIEHIKRLNPGIWHSILACLERGDAELAFEMFAEAVTDLLLPATTTSPPPVPAPPADSQESGAVASPIDPGLVERLAPIFHDNPAQAENFIIAARHMTPPEITAHVNLLVKRRIISRRQCRRPLYRILHEAAIYPCSESNWNKMIR